MSKTRSYIVLMARCQVNNYTCNSVGAAEAAPFKFKTMTVQQSLSTISVEGIFINCQQYANNEH